jgi:hypothetical protein
VKKKAIITFSRRTDPAFHMEELMSWFARGYADVPNPFSGKTYRVSLLPEDILLFTFWTKNPEAVAPYVSVIEKSGVKTGFFVTVNGYSSAIESNVPDIDSVHRGILSLREFVSADALWWRYDPVIFSEKYTESRHTENFKRICGGLWAGNTRRVIFSLAHIDRHYSFARRNLEKALSSGGDVLDMASVASPEYAALYSRTIALFDTLAEIASGYGIEAEVCCSPKIIPGTSTLKQGSCLSARYIEKITGSALNLTTKGTRKGGETGYAPCSCLESRDIGIYGTCGHGCAYCYARRSK